jgi:hypothetical protein
VQKLLIAFYNFLMLQFLAQIFENGLRGNMSVNSSTMAIVPYTHPMTAWEFIKSEVEKGLISGSISPEQLTQHQSIPPSLSFNLVKINLSLISEIFGETNDIRDSHFSSRRIERQSPGRNRINFEDFNIPVFLPTNFRTGSSEERIECRMPFDNSIHNHKMSEVWQTIVDDLACDEFNTMSVNRIPSSTKLNGDEIAEILQSEAGFTISTDRKPIVATYGCGPCVALGGYDATNGIAFVVHFSNMEEVIKCGGDIFYNLSKLFKKKIESPIQLHLRGGIEGQSEGTISAIKVWMRREDLPMEIASEDILGDGMSYAKSLFIDSRNGAVSNYDPLLNPKSRKMSDFDAISTIMRGINANIKITYTPK